MMSNRLFTFFLLACALPSMGQTQCDLFNIQDLASAYLSFQVDTVLLQSNGSYEVELSNGEVGVVVETNHARPNRPKVLLVLRADKTPYKTHASANIAPGGKKSGDPGLYVHADAHHLRIGGGAYWVEKDDLYVLRERMAANPQAFNDLIADTTFTSHYGTVLGERNVRLPKEFQSAAEVCPHIHNKQFYFMAELPANTLLREDLLDIVMAHFEAAAPLRSYLREGLRAG